MYAERIGKSASVFMACVLEYVAAEILEVAGEVCLSHKKKTISPSHINLGMRSDFELAKLGANMIVSSSSTPQNINPFLNPKKGKKDKKEDMGAS